MASLKSKLKDPHGLPDWTIPTAITAQLIDLLKIDIASQTLANLKIDIVGQSVGNLGVDIKAQSVGNLNVNIAAAASTVTLKVDISAQSIGNINVNIAASAITLNVNISAQSVNLNVYTGSGLKVMVGVGLITKFYKVAQGLNSGYYVNIITINGKGRLVSVGIKAYDIAYSLAQNVELQIIADGATVFDATIDQLDYINGRQMSYALRSGTSSSPVYASAPLLNPEGGVVAGYGWVQNRNGIAPDELLRLIEAYAIANPKVEFNTSCVVRIYNGSSGTINLYVGVEYGLYP